MTTAPQPSRAYEVLNCGWCPNYHSLKLQDGRLQRTCCHIGKDISEDPNTIPTWCPLPAMPEKENQP